MPPIISKTMMRSRLSRLAAEVGMLGPCLLGAILSGLTIAQSDFLRGLGWTPASPLDWPSALALGPYGALMTITFMVNGIFMAAFALGLRSAIKGGRAAQAGCLGLLLAGLALAGLAFPTDLTIRSTPATWHGLLHDLFYGALGCTLLPAMLFLGRAFQNDAHWQGFGLYTYLTAAFAIPAFVLKGIAFYLFLGVILVWSEVIALQLHRLTRLS
jgi:hypothetical protein